MCLLSLIVYNKLHVFTKLLFSYYLIGVFHQRSSLEGYLLLVLSGV